MTRTVFARLFPARTMTAAKAEARELGITIRPDPLGPCLDGGRLIEVFPKGEGSRAISADDPAEAVFWARCFAEDSAANRFAFSGPSKDSQVRVIVAAALAARGFGSDGVSLTVTFTPGPSISAEVVATVQGHGCTISARFHEYATRGPLAFAAEELAEELATRWLNDCNGASVRDMKPTDRARFRRLEIEFRKAAGVNEGTAEAARASEAAGDWAQSSGPKFYGDAAEAFRHAAALFRLAATQTQGHGKRARYEATASGLDLKADSVAAMIRPAPEVTAEEPAPEVTAEEPAPEVTAEEPAPEVRRIDLTPTWESILPALLAVLENGNPRGRDMAEAELRRMAKAADSAVADQKARAAGRDTAKAAEAEARAALVTAFEGEGQAEAEAAFSACMDCVSRADKGAEAAKGQPDPEADRAAEAALETASAATALAEFRRLTGASKAAKFGHNRAAFVAEAETFRAELSGILGRLGMADLTPAPLR